MPRYKNHSPSKLISRKIIYLLSHWHSSYFCLSSPLSCVNLSIGGVEPENPWHRPVVQDNRRPKDDSVAITQPDAKRRLLVRRWPHNEKDPRSFIRPLHSKTKLSPMNYLPNRPLTLARHVSPYINNEETSRCTYTFHSELIRLSNI